MYPETGEDEINRWEPQALLVQKASRPPPRLYTPPPKMCPKLLSLLIRQIGGALLLGQKSSDGGKARRDQRDKMINLWMWLSHSLDEKTVRVQIGRGETVQFNKWREGPPQLTFLYIWVCFPLCFHTHDKRHHVERERWWLALMCVCGGHGRAAFFTTQLTMKLFIQCGKQLRGRYVLKIHFYFLIFSIFNSKFN